MIGSRTIKSAIGATLAMWIAMYIGLEFAYSAGIITLLSVQSTRKQSVEIAIRRFISLLLALSLSTGIFTILGYNPLAFGLYLSIFIPVCVKFKVQDGITPSSVLVTHLMSFGASTWLIWLNEIGIFIIGAGVALILNLYMPSNERQIKLIRRKVELIMSDLLNEIAEAVEKHNPHLVEEELYLNLEQEIINGKKLAYKHMNNALTSSVITPYERYFDMRSNQYQVLSYMRKRFVNLSMDLEQAQLIATFTRNMTRCVQGDMQAKDMLVRLDELREHFKQSNLPSSREEFENRAMLYQYLNDIEQFLYIKLKFRESLDDREFVLYWRGYKEGV